MMSKRKETPDLMGNLLAGTDKAVSQQSSISTSTYQHSSPSDYLETADKMRATHYFLPDTLDFLEDTTPKLKTFVSKVLGREKRHYVSKSLLVERAVRLMLEDYEQNGAESLIAKDLMRLR